MSRVPLRGRLGFTLIEAMVVISLISIVLFGGMALIVGVRQAGRTVAAQHHNARSLQALSRD